MPELDYFWTSYELKRTELNCFLTVVSLEKSNPNSCAHQGRPFSLLVSSIHAPAVMFENGHYYFHIWSLKRPLLRTSKTPSISNTSAMKAVNAQNANFYAKRHALMSLTTAAVRDAEETPHLYRES